MEIFLNILIFILLGILVIFGIILLIVTVAIFTPVRYSVDIQKEESEILAQGKITWLLKIFSLTFDYNDQLTYKIRIFGMSKWPLRRKSKEELIKIKDEAVDAVKDTVQDIAHDVAEDVMEEDIPVKEEPTQEEPKKQKKPKDPKTKAKRSSNFKLIKRTLKQVYNYPHKKHIIRLFKNYLKNLLKAIKPKKLIIHGEIGIGAYETGILLATMAMLAPKLSYHVTGNFTQTVINGRLQAKGKLAPSNILLPTISFLIKKPIRNLIKKTYHLAKQF